MATRSPARAPLSRSALKVVLPAQSSGVVSSADRSSGIEARALCGTTTWSASPTASIRPAISCPGTRGYSIPGTPPSMVKASEWQTPQACTRTSTSPGPGSRSSRSAWCRADRSFQVLGQGCDLLGAAPRERGAGAAVAVVVDHRGAVGEVGSSFQAHRRTPGAQAGDVVEHRSVGECRGEVGAPRDDGGRGVRVRGVVQLALVQRAAEDDVVHPRMDVGAAVGMVLVADREGEAGVGHPHDLPAYGDDAVVVGERAGAEAGAADHEVGRTGV